MEAGCGPSSVVFDGTLGEYDFGPEHPMSPLRVALTMRLAGDLGVLDGWRIVVAHDHRHVEQATRVPQAKNFLRDAESAFGLFVCSCSGLLNPSRCAGGGTEAPPNIESRRLVQL